MLYTPQPFAAGRSITIIHMTQQVKTKSGTAPQRPQQPWTTIAIGYIFGMTKTATDIHTFHHISQNRSMNVRGDSILPQKRRRTAKSVIINRSDVPESLSRH